MGQNIKAFVNTQNFLEKHGLTQYEDLISVTEEKQKKVEILRSKIKELESDLGKQKSLKNHIINFAKTKKVFDNYKISNNKEEFYSSHSEDIIIHEGCKKAFADLNVKKLPKVKELNSHISSLYKQKAVMYEEYKTLQAELKELQTVKRNVEKSNAHRNIANEKESIK